MSPSIVPREVAGHEVAAVGAVDVVAALAQVQRVGGGRRPRIRSARPSAPLRSAAAGGGRAARPCAAGSRGARTGGRPRPSRRPGAIMYGFTATPVSAGSLSPRAGKTPTRGSVSKSVRADLRRRPMPSFLRSQKTRSDGMRLERPTRLDDGGGDARRWPTRAWRRGRATTSSASTRPRGRASSTSRPPSASRWLPPCRPCGRGRSRGAARCGPRPPSRGPCGRAGGRRPADRGCTCRRCRRRGSAPFCRWTLGTVRISAAASTRTGTPRACAIWAMTFVLSGLSSASRAGQDVDERGARARRPPPARRGWRPRSRARPPRAAPRRRRCASAWG